MKKFVQIIALLTVAVWTAAGAEPENFIPRQAPGIIRIDINRVLTSPELKTVIDKNNKLKSFLDQISDMLKSPSGRTFKTSELFSGQLWTAQTGSTGKEAATYSKTAVPEAELQAIISRNPAGKIVEAAGRKAYIYHRNGENLAVVYLAEDVLLISRLSERLVQEISSSLQGGGNPLLAHIDRKALVAVAADVAAVTGKKRAKIKFINGKMDLSKSMDLTGKVMLHCKNSNEALKTAMKIQFAIPGLIGMLFSQDEKLAAALSEALQVMPQQDKLVISYDLQQDTLQQAVKYMSKLQNLPRLPENKAVGPKKNK